MQLPSSPGTHRSRHSPCTGRPCRPVLAGCLLALVIAASGCHSPQPPQPTEPLPVLAWLGPPADQTTPERYRELAAAGFNVSFSGFPDANSMARALDVAHGAGVRLMVACPELQSEPELTVRRFMGHPAVAGYYLRDEPAVPDFKELGRWVRRIRAVDDQHPCYVNLFPTYASAEQLGAASYRDYVTRFLAEVPVQVVSFDHYPIVGDRIRPDWYENLEVIAEAARGANKPFWAFALSVAHDPYPVATVAGLRLQVFSDLAYGARAIQYFTYWTPPSTTWNFHEAPLESGGRRTPVYDHVRQVNAELQRLASRLHGTGVLSVAHAGEILPRGTRRYQPAAPVLSLSTAGKGVVVSLLRGPSEDFLVVVNRELKDPCELVVRFQEGVKVRILDGPSAARGLAGNGYQGRVDPGDVRVFVWPR